MNERMNKSTLEKEPHLDSGALDMNSKRFDAVVEMDDSFLTKCLCSLCHAKYFNLHFSPLK